MRAEWRSLNGPWEFAFDREARWDSPGQVQWDRTIVVPFSPETPASGIDDPDFSRACWYRRTFEPPRLQLGERLVLHFGAVDEQATVWINGHLAARHAGGYTPFSVDVTPLLDGATAQSLVVRAEDDPHDLAKPRGKQDWLREPHGIWYPRSSGIWQSVWLERLPATAIEWLRWTCSLERWEIGLEARLDGRRSPDLALRVRLHAGDRMLADDTCSLVAGQVQRRIALLDPGIDDARNELLWSPESPTLLQATLELVNERGDVLDGVQSYTAMRSVQAQGGQFLLNGRPFALRMALDQGYWPESGLTAPNDDALRRDVELARAMGLNGVRKHQKIEDPRYLYWADTLGLVVWEELPSAYRFSERAVDRLTRTWMEAIRRDSSHPCIVAWVPFNESWGVPDLPASAAQRDFVAALYHLTRALDPTRPTIGNDGWEHVATDILSVHDYDDDPRRLARRYDVSPSMLVERLNRERLAGRLLAVDGFDYAGQPIMLTEFGGLTSAQDASQTWGYVRVDSAEALAERYTELLEVVRSLPLFSGFCYTQFADTYQETNGLLYANRAPKFPLEQIALATRGPRTARDERIESQRQQRRERLMRPEQPQGGSRAD